MYMINFILSCGSRRNLRCISLTHCETGCRIYKKISGGFNRNKGRPWGKREIIGEQERPLENIIKQKSGLSQGRLFVSLYIVPSHKVGIMEGNTGEKDYYDQGSQIDYISLIASKKISFYSDDR